MSTLTERKLRQQLKTSRQTVHLLNGTVSSQRERVESLQHQVHLGLNQLKASQAKPDISMIEARTKLASQVGQLVEAVSKAVVFLVGKEAL